MKPCPKCIGGKMFPDYDIFVCVNCGEREDAPKNPPSKRLPTEIEGLVEDVNALMRAKVPYRFILQKVHRKYGVVLNPAKLAMIAREAVKVK